MSETTSLSLLERAAQAQDAEAWVRLVGVYTPLLQRWLQGYQVQPADTDDLTQEVLAVVLAELPQFQHNQRTGAFRNWLRRVLINRVRTYWRDPQRELLASGSPSLAERLDELADDTSSASLLWNVEHDRFVLARLMASVRRRVQEKTWNAFRLQVVEGKRAEIVADELAMPLNSVYVARSRVLALLRQEATGLVDQP